MYRRGSIFWGILLIVLAGLLLLRTSGIIGGDIFSYFWPLAIIALGVWLILGYATRHQPIQGEQVSVPLQGAASASIRLDHGAGRLNLHSGASAAEVINGTFNGGVNPKSSLTNNMLHVRLRTAEEFWNWWPGQSLDWDIRLNRDIPLSLKVDTGASASIFDLSDLKVTDLDVDSGASSTEITLPSNAGNTRVDIDTGASSLKIHVPNGVAARIRVKSGVAAVNVSGSRFPRIDKELYQSADYSTAANRADITVDAGVGTIDVD